jgi:hypothetical protein
MAIKGCGRAGMDPRQLVVSVEALWIRLLFLTFVSDFDSLHP